MNPKPGILLLISFFLVFSSTGKPAAAFSMEQPLQTEPTDFHQFLQEVRGLSPPQTIQVRITGDWPCDTSAPYSLVSMDFRTYVKNVLPNEWYYWWPEEALKAGAVAVKMYAWYWIDRGGKWPDADMTDNTCDQWFRYGSAHPRTDKAVDETWNWVVSRDGDLFETRHKNTTNCKPPTCIQQSESADLAREGYRWDEILAHFYTGSDLWPMLDNPAGFSLRFYGSGLGDVLIPIEDQVALTGVNVGGGDFTLEWFMKSYAGENRESRQACGDNQNWITGSVVFDLGSSEAEGASLGVSLSNGRLMVGAGEASGGNLTLCGSQRIGDGTWHHAAVQRRASDGLIWLYVDGELDAYGIGPAGDISVHTRAEPGEIQTNNLIIGSNRRDRAEGFYSYSGWLDEIRFSSGLRYPAAGFEAPGSKLPVDGMTTALFRLDEGRGSVIENAASPESITSQGVIRSIPGYKGPEWQISDLFILYEHPLYLPYLQK